jgi:hypothetical protein
VLRRDISAAMVQRSRELLASWKPRQPRSNPGGGDDTADGGAEGVGGGGGGGVIDDVEAEGVGAAERWTLFEMEVGLPDGPGGAAGGVGSIRVCHGDRPLELAVAFVAKHRLPSCAIEALEASIAEQMDAVVRCATTGAAALQKRKVVEAKAQTKAAAEEEKEEEEGQAAAAAAAEEEGEAAAAAAAVAAAGVVGDRPGDPDESRAAKRARSTGAPGN